MTAYQLEPTVDFKFAGLAHSPCAYRAHGYIIVCSCYEVEIYLMESQKGIIDS